MNALKDLSSGASEQTPAYSEHHQPAVGWKLYIWETLKVVITSLAIIIPIRYYLIQPFFVNGASMEPNFHDKDYIMVDKLSYRFHKPQRGDVIVFQYPLDPQEYFIKRIIGLPGETLQIQDNTVTVFNDRNPGGLKLDEGFYLPTYQETVETRRLKLDENEYFVMGDNRSHSSDSRRWGPLSETFISGRALIRLWPFSKILRIPSIKYPESASVTS